MIRLLRNSGLLLLVFSLSFFIVTALCDWICHATQYYQEAARETTVLED